MNTSITLRTGSLFVVVLAALLAGTVAFAGDRANTARTAGPRNTIVTPERAPKADALLATLEVDPADLQSVTRRSAKACSAHRAGPRDTVRVCR